MQVIWADHMDSMGEACSLTESHLYFYGVRHLYCSLSLSPPQDLFSRRNLEVLGTFSLHSSPSVDLEPIEEPEDAGLTDRLLRLAASLFWFVCAVLLLVRESLWACFPGVSSSTSSVVFLHSETGEAWDSALASSGGRGGRGRRSCLDVCAE